jgi:ATP-dependent DNA ligase
LIVLFHSGDHTVALIVAMTTRSDSAFNALFAGKVDKTTTETDLCYFIFDAPNLDGDYMERLEEAKRLVALCGECANVQFCETSMCPDRESLRAYVKVHPVL